MKQTRDKNYTVLIIFSIFTVILSIDSTFALEVDERDRLVTETKEQFSKG